VPELDALDTLIYGLLAEDGRMSNLDVAARVGVSEKTVRQRIRRLVERDGMRVVAVMDLGAPPSRIFVLVRVEPGQRLAVAGRLASMPRVDEVHLTTGAYELVVLASFGSDSEALELLRHVEQVPGVGEALSTHVVETITGGTAARLDRFEQFDEQAAAAGSVAELLDLACDAATAVLGADRVHVSAATPPTMRWRGLSSRYVEGILARSRDEGVVLPGIVEHNQHVFAADARTDALFRSAADLVLSEGFRSWMGMPVAGGGTLCLYWDDVIAYRDELVVQSQRLADTLGSHLPRFGRG
jgi:DNA-binding Lrp family transcriptional regulator